MPPSVLASALQHSWDALLTPAVDGRFQSGGSSSSSSSPMPHHDPHGPVKTSFTAMICPDNFKCVSKILSDLSVNQPFDNDIKFHSLAKEIFLPSDDTLEFSDRAPDEGADDNAKLDPISGISELLSASINQGDAPGHGANAKGAPPLPKLDELWEEGCPLQGVQEPFENTPDHCDFPCVHLHGDSKDDKGWLSQQWRQCKQKCFSNSVMGFETRGCGGEEDRCKCVPDTGVVGDGKNFEVEKLNLQVLRGETEEALERPAHNYLLKGHATKLNTETPTKTKELEPPKEEQTRVLDHFPFMLPPVGMEGAPLEMARFSLDRAKPVNGGEWSTSWSKSVGKNWTEQWQAFGDAEAAAGVKALGQGEDQTRKFFAISDAKKEWEGTFILDAKTEWDGT